MSAPQLRTIVPGQAVFLPLLEEIQAGTAAAGKSADLIARDVDSV